MSDSGTKTKTELLDEVCKLRERVDLLESNAFKHQNAEEQLRESERKSSAWLEHSPVCTKIVDLDFNLQYMSTAGAESLRISDVKPYYGKPYPFDFCPQSFRDQMTANLERAKETGEIATQEAAVTDIDGEELWFHSTLVPVNDDDGRVDYIIIVSIDITERKQAEVQHRRLTEQERQRIARELHDTTGQELTGLGFMAQSVLEQLAADPHPAEETVRKIEEGIQRALVQVRRFAQGLMPVELDVGGLMAALQALATNTTEACNISCTFRGDHPVSIEDNTMATQIYLIAKEAVANAVKHAQAEHVEIEVSRYDNRVTLLVRDDGVGIGEPSAEDGIGIRIMRHRAALIQGTVEIEPVDLGGTLVMCAFTM